MKVVKKNAYDVVNAYGAYKCYNARYKAVYGFEWLGEWFWFNRKGDAEKAGNWVVSRSWDGMGDLEMILYSEGIELKKVYF